MKQQEPRIFLSYAHKDIAVVKELYDKLSSAGYKPWMDCHDLRCGEKWQPAIEEAIETAHFFLACLSSYCVDHDGQVQAEFKTALDVWRTKSEKRIFLIPVRLDQCEVPRDFKKFHWVNYYEKDGFSLLLKSLRDELGRLGIIQKLTLRSQTIGYIVKEDVAKMLQEKDFYDKGRNWQGKGIQHQYEPKKVGHINLVIDHTTGLTWQQSGSPDLVDFTTAQAYISELNEISFVGYNGWRLPTLEEAMSLMEPKQSENGLFVSSVFDKKQQTIWTADHECANFVWRIDFFIGGCFIEKIDSTLGSHYVRAVCSQ